MFYIDRMYLNQILKPINRKDIRAAIKWCEKNGVEIFHDEFVIKSDFDLAYDLPLITKLKKEHGDEWQVMYQAYKNDTVYKMLDLDSTAKKNNSNYTPMGEVAKTNIKVAKTNIKKDENTKI